MSVPMKSPGQSMLLAYMAQEGLLQPQHWSRYFAKHSRSFSLASRFFPAQERQMVTGVYAYSRLTDDIVDGEYADTLEQRAEMLQCWYDLSKQAYHTQDTGVFLLDRVLGQMADRAVPFDHAAQLIEGMRMDLTGSHIPDEQTLYRYAYRVASTIGLWLTQLFGVHEPWMLARAAALGEAMQLTNILRDVGEDLRRHRIYLPQDRMDRYGVHERMLQEFLEGRPISENYQALIEDLLRDAEQRYEEALVAVPGLPPFFQKPVMVAAYVYRGIHAQIRAQRYDNIRHRARTSWWDKLRLMWQALRRLRQEKARFPALVKVERTSFSVFTEMTTNTPVSQHPSSIPWLGDNHGERGWT